MYKKALVTGGAGFIGSHTADLLFKQSWSSALWTNVIFILVIAAVLAIVWKSGK